MKQFFIKTFSLSCIVFNQIHPIGMDDSCSVTVIPLWCTIRSPILKRQETEWVATHKIIFRKKINKTININSLSFSWKGKPVDKIVSSLYRKKPNKPFVPTEETICADGTWHKTEQLLQFSFKEKVSIGSQETFYVILQVSKKDCSILKKNELTIVPQSLPKPFCNRITTILNQHTVL